MVRIAGLLSVLVLAATVLGSCDGNGSPETASGAGAAAAGCPADLASCGEACVRADIDPENCGACGKICDEGLVCQSGDCALACSGGTTKCGSSCIDVASDREHCGACDAECSKGEVCSAGECGLDCVGGTTKCGAKCVATDSDLLNCGACDSACGPGLVCSAGQCVVTCLGGTTKCGNECVDTQLDPSSCGSCNDACGIGEVCSGGQCGITCLGGTAHCGNLCVDTALDPANCGSCAVACGVDEVCSVGTCGLDCVGGTTKCGAQCVSTDADAGHCGGCGKACLQGEVCSNGVCGLVCGGGATKCGNACVSIATDEANCGLCGKTCLQGEVCTSGVCIAPCGSGLTKCGNLCVDTMSDKAHCGGCNLACAANESCVAGKCSACTDLSSVAAPVNHVSFGSTHGAWMADPFETLGAGKLWSIDFYHSTTTVRRYASLSAFIAQSAENSFNAAPTREGTGHVVSKGFLYYPAENTNTMVKLNLSTGVVAAQKTLPNAGFHNSYHYQWGGYSDIDFAVDEQGLWVIYATAGNAGNIVVSKLDADLNILATYNTARNKPSSGNAFMLCGKLYVTASYSSQNTTIDYRYDPGTNTATNPAIAFTNPGGYNSHIAYNHKEKKLYSWDNGFHQTYALTFK